MAHYFRSTGANWGTVGDWSATPSPTYTAVAAIPSATDDVIFEAASANCVLGANRVCRDLTFTGYANTLSMATFTLSSFRSVTLQANISSRVTGTTGALQMAQTTGGTAASGTLTSNGGTWPLNFAGGSASSSVTITLADNFTCSGNATINTGPTYSGNTFSTNGNFTSQGGGLLTTSTTNFRMTGTGNLSLAGGCNMELNTSGTITVVANMVSSRRFVITNVGTLNGLSSYNFTFIPSAASNTIDFGTGNRTIQDFATNTSANTTTISNSFTCRDFSLIGTTYNGPTSPTTATITITRNYNNTAAVTTNGTLLLVMNAASGAGSITNGSQVSTLPLTINAGANTITLGAAFTIGNGAVLTKTSGNINAGTSTANVPANASATISGMTFWDLTILGLSTITQSSANTIQNNLTIGASNNVTFAGSAGWTCTNLICSTAGRTITLQNSVTYTTTGSATITATALSNTTFTSDSGSVRAIWTLNNGATQSVAYIAGTRIDSSLGQTIWSYGVTAGQVSTSLNWNPLTAPITVAYTFVN